MFKPEVLAPAGSLEKMKVAILYGADAVYLSGQQYGLRASADNFTAAELELAMQFAHQRDAKVYVTVNGFLHDEDLVELGAFSKFLESIHADAVIVSDLGVARVVRRHCNLPLHLSTQTSCLNSYAAKAWRELGIERIILGREVSIAEAALIQEAADVQVEMFVHGAMCMSYSGKCRISNFTAGRDANRGGCIQSCRFLYEQQHIGSADAGEDACADAKASSHFMSSKDLWGIFQIDKFVEHRISSLKIEGRMKSALWAATLTKAYREAVDLYCSGAWSAEQVRKIADELETMPHRAYTEASLIAPAGAESIYLSNASPAENATRQMLGMVLEVESDQMILRLYRNLKQGEAAELVPFEGAVVPFEVNRLADGLGDSIDGSRQSTVVRMPALKGAKAFSLVRVVSHKKDVACAD
ncbi:U32 family peptidase [Oligoflexia bacterium]|nr:U32 family peptidase [Oligoflexia bacterium]